MPTYTTTEMVKARVNAVSGALSTDRIISGIMMAEGIVDAVMRKSGVSGASVTPDYNYDSNKHGLIRDTTTALAAFMVLTNDVELFTSTSTGSITADLLWAEADRGLAILSDPRVIYYLTNR